MHWPNYLCKNDWWGTSPSTWNFGSNWPRWSEIADFRSIFARSASAVTPSETSSIITNRKSTTRFQMSPRWSSYVVPKPPKRGSKTQSVLNLNNKLWYLRNGTIGCQLLLITNRKSHTGFGLVPTSMTLDDLERRNSPYFAFFSPISISLLLITAVVEYRPILSVNIVFQFQSSTFGHN